MSALDAAIELSNCAADCGDIPKEAEIELAALCADVKRLTAERDDLLEAIKTITAPDAEWAQLRATVAEQARQLSEAQKHLTRMTDYCQYWLLAGKIMTGSNDGLILRDDVNTCRAWLAANPAHLAPQPDEAQR